MALQVELHATFRTLAQVRLRCDSITAVGVNGPIPRPFLFCATGRQNGHCLCPYFLHSLWPPMSTPHPQSQPETSTAPPAQGSVPNSPPPDVPLPGAAQTVLNFMGQANTAREQLSSSAREQISHPREHLSDPPTSATVMGAAQNVLSRLASSSAHHFQHHHSQAASTSGFQPLPEVPRDLSAEAPAPPADAPTSTPAPARPAEPTAPPSTSTPTHGATVGRAITPTRGSRTARLSYPAVPEVAHSRPIPVPYGTAYRRSAGPYVDSETAWNATDERDPVRSTTTTHRSPESGQAHSSTYTPSSQFREPTVKERIGETISSAKFELTKATYNGKGSRLCGTYFLFFTYPSCWYRTAWKTNLLLNIALSLQVLIGALTTALGAALGGKKVRRVKLARAPLTHRRSM
jgi:hypothetical protein